MFYNALYFVWQDCPVARVIQICVEFLNLGEVDTRNEKFAAIVKIRSRWQEDEEIIDYDAKKHWNPRLFIENAHYDVKEEISYRVEKYEEKRTLLIETRISKGLIFFH